MYILNSEISLECFYTEKVLSRMIFHEDYLPVIQAPDKQQFWG